MNQFNNEYVNQSLINQIAELSMRVAERDAIITEQQVELKELRKERIEEMDDDAE